MPIMPGFKTKRQNMIDLPDSLIIGPMKSGTSWIQDYLSQRVDVGLPQGVKETFFFDHRFSKGKKWYASHFICREQEDAPDKIVEVAPSYFHSLQAPENVYYTLGNIPLIVVLRDPVQRAWSHYLHLLRYGYTREKLPEATIKYPEILEASRYQSCLVRWYEFFPEESFFFLRLEALLRSPEDFTAELCKALDISFLKPSEQLGGNKSNKAAMPSSFLLAAIANKTAHFLRQYRFYSLVNFAKNLGLKNVFFGNPEARSLPTMSREDEFWLQEKLAGETI